MVKITPVGRVSFANLFEAKPDQSGNEYFNATLIFPAGTDLSQIEADMDAAAEKAWGAKKAAKLKKMKHFPVKSNVDCTNGDGDRYGGYEDDDGRHVKFKNAMQPGVVGREKDPSDPTKLLALKKGEIKNGDYARVSYTCFAGEHPEGGPYIRMSLNNCQLIKEGEPFGQTISDSAEDFAADIDEDVLALLGM